MKKAMHGDLFGLTYHVERSDGGNSTAGRPMQRYRTSHRHAGDLFPKYERSLGFLPGVKEFGSSALGRQVYPLLDPLLASVFEPSRRPSSRSSARQVDPLLDPLLDSVSELSSRSSSSSFSQTLSQTLFQILFCTLSQTFLSDPLPDPSIRS